MASEEVISTTTKTYVDEHDDGSVTKTEVSATVTKKKQIEYAFQRKSTVVLKADDNDKKYADALDKKEEFAVFIGKVNPLPVTFVRNKSVVKVLGLIGKTFRDGYDEVVFGIYTMREITAIKMAVRKTYIKANDCSLKMSQINTVEDGNICMASFDFLTRDIPDYKWSIIKKQH